MIDKGVCIISWWLRGEINMVVCFSVDGIVAIATGV